MSSLWQNVRFSWRLLGKNPGCTAVAVLTLALGIGANTAIFSVVYGALLAPLPMPHPEQLVMVWSDDAGRNVSQRTQEIGLRMAVGAGSRQVLLLVLKEGMLLALAGLVLGLGGTYFVGRAMRSVLYQVGAIDFASVGSRGCAALAGGDSRLLSRSAASHAHRSDGRTALRMNFSF
jgi:hypothetical protein